MKIYPKRKNGRRVDTTQQTRHTHSVAAGLEDLIAIANDIIFEQQRALAYTETRMRTLLEILKTIRAGPHRYDQDRPSGLRITVRRR